MTVRLAITTLKGLNTFQNNLELAIVFALEVPTSESLAHPSTHILIHTILHLMARFIILILIIIGVLLAIFYYATGEKSKADRRMYKILKRRYLQALEGENKQLLLAAGKEFGESHVAQKDDLDQLYKDALRLARDDEALTQYAFEIGRLRYGARHKDGMPTIHDEAAIANDIKTAKGLS